MAAITAATFLSYVLMHIFTYEDLDICVVVVIFVHILLGKLLKLCQTEWRQLGNVHFQMMSGL